MKSSFPLWFLLIACAAISYSFADAQGWKNPVDRYQESYKSYLNAECPIGEDGISHFVYFARDRGRIRNHSFLENDRFSGAQIMYPWQQLERSEGKYDFSQIRSDLAYLKSHGKSLFIQLQDVTFSPKYKPIPKYLLQPRYDGGVVPATVNGKTIGWVSKRWNPLIQERFAALLKALGDEFDGEIEGINLQETAIEVTSERDPSFSPQTYAEAIKINMRALKAAFPNSTTMQYANFMPGEWLPWEDEGYLQGIYKTGEEIGVGLGTPDLMFKRRAQLNHPIAMMHEGDFTVPLGIAIQDGNYVGSTGADTHFKDRETTEAESSSVVPLLHAFADDFLKVDYMFWVDQEPYFRNQVLPCFSAE